MLSHESNSVVFDVYISNKKPELPASEMGYVVKLLDVENSKRIIGYYGAAKPPVRQWRSHLSGLTEPPAY